METPPKRLVIPKLHIEQVKLAEYDSTTTCFTFGGLSFRKVWVQGDVASISGSSITVSDGTETLTVTFSRAHRLLQEVRASLQVGDYVLVIGLLRGKANPLALVPFKVLKLEHAVSRKEMWEEELVRFGELYASMAEEQQLAEGMEP